jgi:hypothetical protein
MIKFIKSLHIGKFRKNLHFGLQKSILVLLQTLGIGLSLMGAMWLILLFTACHKEVNSPDEPENPPIVEVDPVKVTLGVGNVVDLTAAMDSLKKNNPSRYYEIEFKNNLGIEESNYPVLRDVGKFSGAEYASLGNIDLKEYFLYAASQPTYLSAEEWELWKKLALGMKDYLFTTSVEDVQKFGQYQQFFRVEVPEAEAYDVGSLPELISVMENASISTANGDSVKINFTNNPDFVIGNNNVEVIEKMMSDDLIRVNGAFSLTSVGDSTVMTKNTLSRIAEVGGGIYGDDGKYFFVHGITSEDTIMLNGVLIKIPETKSPFSPIRARVRTDRADGFSCLSYAIPDHIRMDRREESISGYLYQLPVKSRGQYEIDQNDHWIDSLKDDDLIRSEVPDMSHPNRDIRFIGKMKTLDFLVGSMSEANNRWLYKISRDRGLGERERMIVTKKPEIDYLKFSFEDTGDDGALYFSWGELNFEKEGNRAKLVHYSSFLTYAYYEGIALNLAEVCIVLPDGMIRGTTAEQIIENDLELQRLLTTHHVFFIGIPYTGNDRCMYCISESDLAQIGKNRGFTPQVTKIPWGNLLDE